MWHFLSDIFGLHLWLVLVPLFCPCLTNTCHFYGRRRYVDENAVRGETMTIYVNAGAQVNVAVIDVDVHVDVVPI